MHRFAIIGLGRFGSRLATNLASAGREVIAIDRDMEVIESMRDRVTLAVSMDASDAQAMRAQGVDKVDVGIVAIGADFRNTILATAVLRELEVPRVISRATSPIETEILTRIGAHDVVNPEDEAADRWGNRLTSPTFLNQFEVAAGVSIVESRIPKAWIGRTLAELNLRNQTGIHVLAIKQPVSEEAPAENAANVGLMHLPMPDQPLAEGITLLLMGQDGDLAALPRDD